VGGLEGDFGEVVGGCAAPAGEGDGDYGDEG
jgi:hypothetical protein